MGIFSSIKKAFNKYEVIYEGASDADRKLFSEIVEQVALLYRSGKQREMFLSIKFDANVSEKKNLKGEMVYRILGNCSMSKESLFDAYKDGVIKRVKTFTL